MENKPEQTLEELLRGPARRINKGLCPENISLIDCGPRHCDECYAKGLSTAIRSAGYVQLSKNQEAPVNEMCGAPNDDWEQAQKVMLTPDANGEAFRRVIILKEE